MVKRPNVCLVVPTIREQSIRDFVVRWDRLKLFDRVDLLLMEDNPKNTFRGLAPLESGDSSTIIHYSWEDIDNNLENSSWIIPRRSDTVRSFGYLQAYRLGYDYILTLDDDCYPPDHENDGVGYQDGAEFVDAHLAALTGKTRWFNTLNDVIPRGIPYFNRGKNDRVIVNHGLWTNVLDYDAPRQLVAPKVERHSFDSKIVPANSYFPMCGMNVMWKRDFTVLMYHLLMGQQVYTEGQEGPIDPAVGVGLNKLPFDRFGDIWCGIIMKKIADVCRLNVATGMPYIRHERASNPFANLKKEANGLEVNEKLWEWVDLWVPPPSVESVVDMYADMGKHISAFHAFPEHNAYFEKLGWAMELWAGLFRA